MRLVRAGNGPYAGRPPENQQSSRSMVRDPTRTPSPSVCSDYILARDHDTADPHIQTLGATRAQRSALQSRFDYYLTYARALHLIGNYRRELDVARRMRQLFPDLDDALAVEMRALVSLSRVDELRPLLDRAVTMSSISTLEWTAEELRVHGHTRESRDVALELAERIRARPPQEAQTVTMRGEARRSGDGPSDVERPARRGALIVRDERAHPGENCRALGSARRRNAPATRRGRSRRDAGDAHAEGSGPARTARLSALRDAREAGRLTPSRPA